MGGGRFSLRAGRNGRRSPRPARSTGRPCAKALEHDRERIENLPWKVGSGMRKGARPGVFFCAVVGRESEFERTYLRFVAADEDWRPRSDGDAIERELGTCLRSIECAADTATWYPEDLRERAHDFWDVAQGDILLDWMRETDPVNLQPSVRPLNHRVAGVHPCKSAARHVQGALGTGVGRPRNRPGRAGRKCCCATGSTRAGMKAPRCRVS